MVNQRVKRLLVLGIAPELVSTFVGIIIGIVTYHEEIAATRSLTHNLVEWIININAGAVAHQLAWLLLIKLGYQQPIEGVASLRSIWKPTGLGTILTFVFVFLINQGWQLPREVIVMMFFQVIAICVIVHIFLFQFRFYSTQHRLMQPESGEIPPPGEEAIDSSDDFIALNIDERIEKVKLDQVSHIKVEDHYCTIVYVKENTWQQWTVYGKLKTYEEQYGDHLLRINRSVLANPRMVARVERVSGKHHITLKGEPEQSFTLSASQKHLLDHLIPTVQP